MTKIAVVILSVVLVLGCSHFSVLTTPSGISVRENGAPLLSRQGEFVIVHEWLDADNVLHEIRISRNTEENADAQYRALDRMAGLVEAVVLQRTGTTP